MVIYKFGGASVRNADAVRNLAKIVSQYPRQLVIVVSAMGKTTTALEELVKLYVDGWFNAEGKASRKPLTEAPDDSQMADIENWHHFKNRAFEKLEEIKKYHLEIVNNLFPDTQHQVYEDVEVYFSSLTGMLNSEPSTNYDYEYDRIVAFGEIISTRIVSHLLNQENIPNEWVDARKCIKTTNFYRDPKIDWESTSKLVPLAFNFKRTKIHITQGFIGSTSDNHTTTLGREGSDFTAAILAFSLNAEYITIWKDVDGVYNADPKWIKTSERLQKISYHEAIELTYYGATVIHPKTIKPLQNKRIPLYVRSFISPENPGTLIHSFDLPNVGAIAGDTIPVFIRKPNQVLISVKTFDFSFVAEDNLSTLFAIFAKYRVRTNLMQNSAISFMACVDYDATKLPKLVRDLSAEFEVEVTEDLELITIRHFTPEVIEKVIGDKKILLQQKSRVTARFVIGK